jgi:hypothetical protein
MHSWSLIKPNPFNIINADAFLKVTKGLSARVEYNEVFEIPDFTEYPVTNTISVLLFGYKADFQGE